MKPRMDRRALVKSLFLPKVWDNPEQRLYVQALIDQMGYLGDLIELFPDLTNADYCPEEFLRELAGMVGYTMVEGEDFNIQREIIKRIFSAYGQRGTEDAIIKAFKRGNDDNWVIGDLTLYKGPLEEQDVEVEKPKDYIFKYSDGESLWSDKWRYQDNDTWNYGIYYVKVRMITQKLLDAVEFVRPAGLRFIIMMFTGFHGSYLLNSEEVTIGSTYDGKTTDIQDIDKVLDGFVIIPGILRNRVDGHNIQNDAIEPLEGSEEIIHVISSKERYSFEIISTPIEESEEDEDLFIEEGSS